MIYLLINNILNIFGFFKKKMTWSTFVVSCYLYLLEIKIIFKKSILFDSLLTKSAKTFFKPHPTIWMH